MLSSRPFLEKCEKLRALGLALRPETGTRVGRGFADLGYEEFSILTAGKMVSLMTGQVSKLPEDWSERLFLIPNVDTLSDCLSAKGHTVKSMTPVTSSSWQIEVSGSAVNGSFKGRTIRDALMDACLAVYSS